MLVALTGGTLVAVLALPSPIGLPGHSPGVPDGFEQCRSMEEIARKLLKSVGVEDPDAITPSMIEAAIKANDAFVDELGRIAEEGMH